MEAVSRMFLAMGEAPSARVFFSSERPNNSTVGVICCLVEVEVSCCCLTLATGVEGEDSVVAAAGLVAAEAAVLAALDLFFFWFFERGVEGTSAGVLMPADEGEGLSTEPAGEAAGVTVAIFCPLPMTAALGVAGISISASEKMDEVGEEGLLDSKVFVDVAIVVLIKAGESCRSS